MWFVVDVENNIEYFESEQEARTFVNMLLKEERELARLEGEWYEDIENICWGKVLGQVKCTKDEEGIDDDGYRRRLYDYDIVEV